MARKMKSHTTICWLLHLLMNSGAEIPSQSLIQRCVCCVWELMDFIFEHYHVLRVVFCTYIYCIYIKYLNIIFRIECDNRFFFISCFLCNISNIIFLNTYYFLAWFVFWNSIFELVVPKNLKLSNVQISFNIGFFSFDCFLIVPVFFLIYCFLRQWKSSV